MAAQASAAGRGPTSAPGAVPTAARSCSPRAARCGAAAAAARVDQEEQKAAFMLIVAALPFVSNAVFGPLTQVMAEAFQGGSLADAWGLSGALMGGPGNDPSGPFGWLGTPLPFVVLLAIWASYDRKVKKR